MANRYVYSGGSNTSPYDTWAKAATTLTTAISGSAAGDDFWIASDHSESTAGTVTISFPGTRTSPNRIISVSRAGSTPPVAADMTAGASVVTTSANSMTIAGHFYAWGIAFSAGTGAVNAGITMQNSQDGYAKYENCSFAVPGTNTPFISTGGGANRMVELVNCTMSFGSTSGRLNVPEGPLTWRNTGGSTAVTGATIPSPFLSSTTTNVGGGDILLSGIDLSAFGSGKTLVGSNLRYSQITFQNCKLNASVTIISVPTGNVWPGVSLIGCDSGGAVARNERYGFGGALTTETTIKRTGGASDGTTGYSWKIVTTSEASRTFPFETFEGATWNTSTGSSKTLTVHTVTDNVTLKDNEIWLEVEYLGSSGSPVATLVTDANATVLTTAANQASSTETWTTTGLGTPVKQQLSVSFTPQMAGPIRWRVRVGKASTTVYICPKAELS